MVKLFTAIVAAASCVMAAPFPGSGAFDEQASLPGVGALDEQALFNDHMAQLAQYAQRRSLPGSGDFDGDAGCGGPFGSVNCAECTDGVCTQCSEGYGLDVTSGTCTQCLGGSSDGSSPCVCDFNFELDAGGACVPAQYVRIDTCTNGYAHVNTYFTGYTVQEWGTPEQWKQDSKPSYWNNPAATAEQLEKSQQGPISYVQFGPNWNQVNTATRNGRTRIQTCKDVCDEWDHCGGFSNTQWSCRLKKKTPQAQWTPDMNGHAYKGCYVKNICEEGFGLSSTTGICTACDAGFWSSGGRSPCVPCANGECTN